MFTPKFTYNISPSKNICEYKEYRKKCRGNAKFAFCTRINKFIDNTDCTSICSHRK